MHRSKLEELRKEARNPEAMRKRREMDAKRTEYNLALREVIHNRPGWGWARPHGGYAQYCVKRGQVAIIHVNVETWKYDAEKIGMPYNEKIMYHVDDIHAIVTAVEQYM